MHVFEFHRASLIVALVDTELTAHQRVGLSVSLGALTKDSTRVTYRDWRSACDFDPDAARRVWRTAEKEEERIEELYEYRY